MSLPVIVLGAGGHARVLIDTLQSNSITILGITTPDFQEFSSEVIGIPVIGDDQQILTYPPNQIELVNGVGSVDSITRRKDLFIFFKERGYRFQQVIHPSAIVSKYTKLSEGVQILAGGILQIGCTIGANTIINTKASVDHDCRIGNHVHIAPGTTLSGGIEIADEVHIGTGATIIQSKRIGRNSLVGAGAVVIEDVPENAVVVGVPARIIRFR